MIGSWRRILLECLVSLETVCSICTSESSCLDTHFQNPDFTGYDRYLHSHRAYPKEDSLICRVLSQRVELLVACETMVLSRKSTGMWSCLYRPGQCSLPPGCITIFGVRLQCHRISEAIVFLNHKVKELDWSLNSGNEVM